MPRDQVKPLPEETDAISRKRLGPEDQHDLDEIVRIVSDNFSRGLAEIMAAQERRRRHNS